MANLFICTFVKLLAELGTRLAKSGSGYRDVSTAVPSLDVLLPTLATRGCFLWISDFNGHIG